MVARRHNSKEQRNHFVLSHSSYLRRTVLVGLLTVSAMVGFILLIPTLFILLSLGPGIFFYQQEYVFDSADQRHRIRIYRRMNLPVASVINPSATLSVTVENTETSVLIAEKSIEIHEYPELTEPDLRWERTFVKVKGIESHRDVEFDLPLE